MVAHNEESQAPFSYIFRIETHTSSFSIKLNFVNQKRVELNDRLRDISISMKSSTGLTRSFHSQTNRFTKTANNIGPRYTTVQAL